MADTTKNQFGGTWTQDKLKILRKYLGAYTTALKKQRWFKLVYIDAFAGTGTVGMGNQYPDQKDIREFIDGSVRIALNIEDRPFDELIFIEKDEEKCSKLEQIKREHSGREISIIEGDANNFLRTLEKGRGRWRGVLFLDPFGAQLDWSTLKAIAGYEALDIWLLFPTSAIVRMLPKKKIPDKVSPKWAHTLTRVYGGENWRNLYHENPDLFGESRLEREPGVHNLLTIYQNQLKELFGRRYLDKSKTLKSSMNAPLFEFMFCVGNPSRAAIELAKDIASHLIDRI